MHDYVEIQKTKRTNFVHDFNAFEILESVLWKQLGDVNILKAEFGQSVAI